jgi:hypothetical protein
MLTYDPENHVYKVDGAIKPSVTQIISNVGARKPGKDGKSYWSPIGFDDRFFDDSGNSSTFGKHFHFVARCKVQEKDVEYDSKMRPWVRGLEKFMKKEKKIISNIQQQLVEIPLYSEKYGFAGIPDWHFISLASIYVIDWKTGTFRKSSRIQTAAYAQLVAELLKTGSLMHRWTVTILPDDYKIDKRYREREDWNKFQSLLNVWKMAA